MPVVAVDRSFENTKSGILDSVWPFRSYSPRANRTQINSRRILLIILDKSHMKAFNRSNLFAWLSVCFNQPISFCQKSTFDLVKNSFACVPVFYTAGAFAALGHRQLLTGDNKCTQTTQPLSSCLKYRSNFIH